MSRYEARESSENEEKPKELVPIKKVLGDVYTPRVGDEVTIDCPGPINGKVLTWGAEAWGQCWVVIDKEGIRQFVNMSKIVAFNFERKVLQIPEIKEVEQLELSKEPRIVKSSQTSVISEKDQISRALSVANEVKEKGRKEIELLRNKLNNPERKHYGTTFTMPSFKKRS